MIKSEARGEKTTTAVAPISDNEEKLFPFAEILRGLEEKNNREIIPILERIEFNTSFLKRSSNLKKSSEKTTTAENKPSTAQGIFPRVAPLKHRDEKGRHATTETNVSPKIPVITARLATEEDLGREEKKRRKTSSASTPTTVSTEPTMQRSQEPTAETVPERKEAVAPKVPRGKVSDDTKGERDNRGRFVGTSKSQEARSEQRNKEEKKSLFAALKDGIGGVGAKGISAVAGNADTLEEAAGRAAGGPIFEAAMELKGAVDSARDEDSILGKAARWAGKKTGILKGEDEKTSTEGRDEKGGLLTGTAKTDDGSKKIIETLQGSENEDEKRHEELIRAILKGNKEKGPESMGLPSARRTGPGARGRERSQKAMKKSQRQTGAKTPQMPGGGGPGGGMLGTLLSRFALPGLALAGAGLAGAAVGTGVNKGINWLGETVTGKKGWTAGGAIYDATHRTAPSKSAVEGYKEQRGNIAAAAAATGMSQDTLTKMAGVESSFNPQAGAPSSSARGTFQFTRGTWQAMLKKHGGKYGLAENTSVFDPKANALMGAEYTKENKRALEASGVKADDASLYMAHFLGTGGGVKFMKTLQGGGEDRAAAQDFQTEAGTNKNVFYDKSGRPRSYKEIHSLMSSRMNQFSQDRMDALASGKSETAVASAGQRIQELNAEKETNWDKMTGDQRFEWARKMSAVRTDAAKDQPTHLAKGEPSRRKASPMAAAPVEPVEPIATATATPTADIRKRILPRTGARSTALGGESSEAKPVEGGAMATEPATSLATGMPARSTRPPERMTTTTARAETQEAPSSIPGPKPGRSDMNGRVMAVLEKLNATMAKMTGQDEARGPGVPPSIRTEFDDTMLTLMAYDRV